MDTLVDLYAYNAWANAQVFAVCQQVNQAQLEADAPGTYGTLAETLKHMVQVEDVYLHMLRSESPQQIGPREAYLEHDLAWFEQRAANLGSEYAALIANAAPSFYAEPLDVPWFDFALTKHDGLLQVLSHSAQHRAQVFSVLGLHGTEVPDLDYVLFVESKGAPGNETPLDEQRPIR
jgi:uncharacterized damage-inducible protein DinB